MRSSLRPNVWFLVAASLVGVTACGSKGDSNTVIVPPPSSGSGGSGASSTGGKSGSGGSTGTGGTTTPSGSGGTATGAGGTSTGAGGSTGSGGTTTPSGSGGTVATDGGGSSDTTSSADTSEPPASSDWMGYPGVEDQTVVKKTPGCGMAAGVALNSWVGYDATVAIPANHEGPGGDGKRRYFVKLPTGYDPMKAYKVVIGGSSCVPSGSATPQPIDYSSVTNATGGVIQISPIVEPGVMQDASYNCYDDKDTNSIEYGLLEQMLKDVAGKFCYDQHKVFVQGHSSGGWYANMMGCVYGSTLIRAMSSNNGGLVAQTGVTPPCKPTPTPGMWIHPTGDTEDPAATKRAVDRALKVNKCMGGGADGAWQTAPTTAFTAGGAVACKKYMCPEAFPVVFCQPPGVHDTVPWHPSAGWAFFNAIP